MPDECCCPPRPEDPAERRACPRSGTHGKPIDLNTVKALLTEQALQRVNGSSHRFCPDPACDVVYFNATDQVFVASDIRVPVWQKLPPGARMVCYCFGENEADMRREVAEAGSSQAVDRVLVHIAAGRCACNLRNPSGACCLGDVIAAVNRVQNEQLSDR